MQVVEQRVKVPNDFWLVTHLLSVEQDVEQRVEVPKNDFWFVTQLLTVEQVVDVPVPNVYRFLRVAGISSPIILRFPITYQPKSFAGDALVFCSINGPRFGHELYRCKTQIL